MKRLKIKRTKTIIGIGVFLGVLIGVTLILLKTDSEHEKEGEEILDVLGKHSSPEEFIDSKDMYDDMEFYTLIHNDDGSLNDFGKGL